MCHLRGIVSTAGCKRRVRHMISIAQFQTITPDEILTDRLVFGIRDNKVRERLLRKSKLTCTLADTDEICHAAESMQAHMEVFDDGATVRATIKTDKEQQQKTTQASTDG